MSRMFANNPQLTAQWQQLLDAENAARLELVTTTVTPLGGCHKYQYHFMIYCADPEAEREMKEILQQDVRAVLSQPRAPRDLRWDAYVSNDAVATLLKLKFM